jgi:outer membrane protein
MARRIIELACVAALVPSAASAADPNSMAFAHLGGALVKQADDGELFVNGAPLAGAGFTTEVGTTLTLEGGLFLRDGFAVAASAMIPVTTPNIAAGTIEGMGNLGDETVGFYAVTAQYHLGIHDVVTPYVGAGLAYMHVFDTRDGVVTDLAVASAFGTVLQAGVDVALTDNIGVFADLKKYFISTTASGSLGGVPITANARVDPLVVSTGIGVDF